jgi:hypothetical protein
MMMIEAVRDYLTLLRACPEGDIDRLQRLTEILDRLALAHHRAPETLVENAPDPIGQTPYRQIREAVVRAFPDFGLYAAMNAINDPPWEEMTGDAIDDLADIALELEQVLWRWENNGPEDAVWHFRFGYRSHWRRHLHDLRCYLHARQFGA